MGERALSSIVNRFLLKWILLPALGMLLLGAGIHVLWKKNAIQEKQRLQTRSIQQFVDDYLSNCSQELQFIVANTRPGHGFSKEMQGFMDFRFSFQGVHVLDASGSVLQSFPRDGEKSDFSGILAADDPNKAFGLTVPYYTTCTKSVVVGLVKELSGNRTILAEMNLRTLQDSIAGLTKRLDSGSAFITDAYGNLIAHPEMHRVRQQVNWGHLTIFSDLQEDPPASGLYRRSSGLKMMSAAQSGLSGWAVLVEEDVWSLLRPTLVMLVFALPATVLLFGGVLSFFNLQLRHRIIHPLEDFTQGMRMLEHGEKEQGLPVNAQASNESFAELTSLVTSFQGLQTRIKQRESSLQFREAQLQAIFQASPNPVLVYDQSGTPQFLNPAFSDLFGWTLKEMCEPTSPFVPEDQLEITAEKFDEMYASGQPVRFMSQRRTKQGAALEVMVSAAMMPEYRGQASGMVVNITDISEQRKLETQFQQAQKMESVGRLAGGVAHDFNNLLAAVLGYGEMLLYDPGLGEEHREWVEAMHQAGSRGRDLVGQLLAFSRKQTLEMQILDVNRVLEDFEKLLRKTIRENIRIELQLVPNPPLIQADRGQLEQVIMNLAVNASDSMPEGGCLSLETEYVELDANYAQHHSGVQPGAYVLLAVSDTGSGMDQETRERIFEPFFSTKGQAGTGLGLATVYGIVKQHKGNIWVYSEPGRGTTFKVYFQVGDQMPVRTKVDAETAEDLCGSETILLAEDDEQVRRLGRDVLERQGYQVLAAGDAAEALTRLAAHDGPVHLLLTDVILPGMNGRELHHKAVHTYPGLKVLYMSGYTDNVIAHHGVLDEGVNFIQKPFSVQGLGRKVREVLDG